MTDTAAIPPKAKAAPPRGQINLPQPLLLLPFSFLCLALSYFALSGLPAFTALVCGTAIAILALVSFVAPRWQQSRVTRTAKALMDVHAADPIPSFVTDRDGQLLAMNGPGKDRLEAQIGQSLPQAMSGLLVNAASVTQRHLSAVDEVGHASEMIFARGGQARLSAHKATEACVLWRIESATQVTARVGEGLAMPMLVANRAGAVLSLNTAMRQLLGSRPRDLAAVFGAQEIGTGQTLEITTAIDTITATIVEAQTAQAHREIYVIPGLSVDASLKMPGDIFEALPIAAMKLGAHGEVLTSNMAARDLLCLKDGPETVHLSGLIEGPGRPVRDWLADIVDGRGSQRSEVVRVLRREADFNVKVTIGSFREDNEIRFLAVLEDASDLQFLQQQVAQSQKMQAVGELAGGVAHDFNNLLTAITGHCDLLLLRHDQGDQDYADLVQIHQNANRAASLVGQLLAFSRKQTMKLELIDLRDTMGDLTHLLNRLVGERVSLQLSQDPALQPIRADRRLLDQVLMNLVVNARDAMPDGGVVRIVSRMVRIEDTLRKAGVDVPEGDYVTVEVADEGVGIPPDRLSRIFEPFFTTKAVGEGTGLGLSMAYGIVKQSGGYIFVESQVGVGTRFEIFFPAHDWPQEARPGSDGGAEAGKKKDRGDASGVVLLVEDEAPVRAFASRALRLKGFDVLEAGNGDEALELLDDSELEIDLFVTDMIMPGKGGPEWVREALIERPGVGVVFMSGYAEDAYGKFSEDIPNAVFLAKPFSLADLTETVREQLH